MRNDFYLALSHDLLEDYFKPEIQVAWNEMRMKHCTNYFSVTSCKNFFIEHSVWTKSITTNENMTPSEKKEFC